MVSDGLMQPSQNQVWTLADLRREFDRYSNLINSADLAPTSKSTYLIHADRSSAGWLAGEVEIGPGTRTRCARSLVVDGPWRSGEP